MLQTVQYARYLITSLKTDLEYDTCARGLPTEQHKHALNVLAWCRERIRHPGHSLRPCSSFERELSVGRSLDYWRQLMKVARQHKLDAPERPWRIPDLHQRSLDAPTFSLLDRVFAIENKQYLYKELTHKTQM